MKHFEFIQWVKGLSEDDIAGAGLKNPAVFKAVCLVLATYGDYGTGTGVQPAWTTVAREASVSRTTAHKVRDFLVGNGVLVEVGKTQPKAGQAGNVSIYRFASVDHLTWTTEKATKKAQLSSVDGQLQVSTQGGQLQVSTEEPQLSIADHSQLSIAEPQLSTLGGHNTTLDTTTNTKEDTRSSTTADAAVHELPKNKVRDGGSINHINYQRFLNYKQGKPLMKEQAIWDLMDEAVALTDKPLGPRDLNELYKQAVETFKERRPVA